MDFKITFTNLHPWVRGEVVRVAHFPISIIYSLWHYSMLAPVTPRLPCTTIPRLFPSSGIWCVFSLSRILRLDLMRILQQWYLAKSVQYSYNVTATEPLASFVEGRHIFLPCILHELTAYQAQPPSRVSLISRALRHS